MGKTSKPLTIAVFSPLDEWPEIVKLREQGHTILFGPFIKYAEDADIILGPRCWYMTPLHRKHLTDALKQARLRRYGNISKKKGGEDTDSSGDDLPGSTGC